jgi:hypothetical protein
MMKRRDILRTPVVAAAGGSLAAPRQLGAAAQTTLTFVPQTDIAVHDQI